MIKKRNLTNRMAVIMPTKKTSKFTIQSKAIVDGSNWYTVSCSKDISIWIRQQWPTQESKLWFEHIDHQWTIHLNCFDIHEKLYTMLAIRWGHG